MQNSRTRYVVDTHALWWYFDSPERLSATVETIFNMAEHDNATIVIPAIVAAELYYLSVKLGRPFTPTELMDMVNTIPGFEFSNLGMEQLEKLDTLQEAPEMHDRLIAGEAVALDVPVITRDRAFSDSPQIETVW